jgi:hypothetical protein
VQGNASQEACEGRHHLRALIQASTADSARGFEVGRDRDHFLRGNGSKRRVDGVERQPRCRLAHLDVDHFDAGKREALGVRSQLD